MPLLIFRAIKSNGIDYAKMVVSNLGDGWIGFGDRSKDFHDGGVTNTRSSIGFRDANCPQTTAGKLVQLYLGKDPSAVSFGSSDRKFLGQIAGDGQSFLIGTDAVSIRAVRLERLVVTRQEFCQHSRRHGKYLSTEQIDIATQKRRLEFR